MTPELGQDLSLFHLVLHASLPVQVVMALLLGASLMSWWFIFIKMFALKRAIRVTDRFEREFWGGGDINAIYQRVAGEREGAGEMERIFEAGFREFSKLRHQAGLSLNVIIDGTRRAMRATYQRELDGLESHLSFLATVGSVSPYVGLFGTVWGIMNAFRGLSVTHSSSIQAVAPGIAEALIATATGLVAAIPAVMAYNYFARQIRVLSAEMENFSSEFLNIAERHFLK